MAMDKFKKYQVLILIILAFLLLITHFLPSFMRSPFLYFIFNFLIISLGAEAGFLSSSSSASSISPLHHDKKTSSCSSLMITQKPAVILAHAEAISEVKEKAYSIPSSEPIEKKVILVTVTKPSLFFIACEETEDAEEAMNNKEGEEEEEEAESNEEEELCAKAEAFIGTFYKQLKIQREESWKKIHYHKAF